jgi:phosphate transport system protein
VVRLLDLGLTKVSSIVFDMASLAENTVSKAITSYKDDDPSTKKTNI